jgi:small subunit ribosomal protein S8e
MEKKNFCLKIFRYFFKTAEDEANLNKKRSKKTMLKYTVRQKTGKVDAKLDDLFASGRLYGLFLFFIILDFLIKNNVFILFLASVASRPGKHGRADGYILEGKELEFYLKRLK